MNTSIFGLSPQPQYHKSKGNSYNQFTVTPLGGFGQIGMNCMIWSTLSTRVIVDCGLMFPSDYHLGVDVIIPQFDAILEHRDSINGIILTHGHEDHIGALPHLVPFLNCPIYGSEFTLALVDHKLQERGLAGRCPLRVVSPNSPVTLGDMTFHFFPVCHSIIEGLAVGAETPIGKIIHTGDFKIDPNPIAGPGTDLEAFRRFAGDEGACLLLSDSTNIEKEGPSVTERDVLAGLEHIFSQSSGRIIITLFSSHIQRIQEVFDCADKAGRSVIISGRSLTNNIEMSSALGKLRLPKALYKDDDQIPPLPDGQQVLLVTGSQGEPLSALSRIVTGSHRQLKIHEGDVVIMSSRLIPGNAMAVNTLINNIYRMGAEVYYDKDYPVHASGHGQREDLEAMIKAVRPRYFVPAHGEYRHLVKHRRLAVECGVAEQNAVLVENGLPFTISEYGFSLEDRVPANPIMVDGKGVGDVGQVVLKERHLLGGGGVVVVVMVLDETTWSILHGPELFSKGFVFEQQYSHILEDAKCIVLDAIEILPPGNLEKLSEQVRLDVRRFFRKVLDRDPIVVPAITVV